MKAAKHSFKRYLAYLLVCALVMSNISVTAYAADTTSVPNDEVNITQEETLSDPENDTSSASEIIEEENADSSDVEIFDEENDDPSAEQSLEDELIEDNPMETVSDDQESDISDAASENEGAGTDEDSIFTEDKTQMNPLPKKMPTTALAADRGTVEVPYINDLGGEASADATPLTGSETELGTGFYAVTDNVTFNHPVTVTGSATRIILCDGKTAAFSSISVSTTGNCQLRFYGQEEGSGSLTATNLTGSLIYIYGGTISADTMTATPLNMFDGTLSADALTVGWYADFEMSSHFFGGIVDVDTLTVQDHDFTIGTENTPSPTDSFCAGSYVIAQGLKLHFANTFTAAEPDGNGAYIRYSGDYDNSAAAALNGKTLRPYITHTVNWVVEGETKETDTVLSGSPASYDGATPTKPDEQGKKYIFSGWSDGTNTYAPDALPPVTADVTYTAVFVAGHGIKVWYRYINPDMPNEPSSTVTPSVDVARAGETVTLTVNAAPKEKLTEQQSYSANSSSSVTLTNGFLAYSSSDIISIEKSGDSYSFVMPDAEVTIIAFFDYFNYSITVGEPIHGHMDVYKLNGNGMTAVTAADEGDEIHVRLTADPDDPYIVTGMTYTYTENGVNKTGEISLTNEINQLYLGTFTMPASDVVINIADQAAHRIVYESSALKQEYFSEAAGKTVTLTPENGYTVTSVYVKCGDEYVTVTANADGTFSFTMPDGDVTVFTEFSYIDTEFSYIDLDGSAKTSNATPITGDMTDLGTGWYAVDGSVTNNNRISVNGDVNLILCDGAALTVPKGISVNSGRSLTVWGQTAGTGALTAMIDENDEDLYYLAAIGGYQTSSGSITINGGTVTAKGGTMAAGIGGGRQGDGTVVINGGTVTAEGGDWGAGIGGGQRSDRNGGHGNVTITGGTVTATGGAISAGIGGGYNYDDVDNLGPAGATVVISGGVVNATGVEQGGVGIGGSADDSSISLGWKDFDHDSIKADSYAGMVTLTKDFTDGTNGYAAGAVEDNTVLAGKTLIPAVYVFFDSDGGSFVDDQLVPNGQKAAKPEDPTKEGFSFQGWYQVTDADTGTLAEEAFDFENTAISEDITLKAVWQSDLKLAVYSTDTKFGGSVANVTVSPVKTGYKTGESVTVTAEEKQGYTFLGWYAVTGVSESRVTGYGDKLAETLAYTFDITKDTQITAVYEAKGKATVKIIAVNGAKYMVGDDTTIKTGSQENVPIGTTLKLTAADADQVFQWQNESEKILGTGSTLEYYVTSNTTITLVYRYDAENQSYVQFVSDYGQVLSYNQYSTSSSIDFPVSPTKYGYTFDKWVFEGTEDEATAETIKAKIGTEKIITLKPKYTKDEAVGSVTVNYKAGDTEIAEASTTADIPVGNTKTFTAQDIDGYTFECWKSEDGTVLGYKKDYFMQVTGEHMLNACYVAEGVEVEEAKPTIVIGELEKVTSGSTHKVRGSVTRSIPDGYTLIEHGILYGKDRYGLNEETFLYTDGTDGIKKYHSNDTMLNGVVTLSVKVGADDVVVAFRGYMLLKNTDTGEQIYYYTGIKKGSYQSVH